MKNTFDIEVCSLKYKKWVNNIKRQRNGGKTRLFKVRLDKNERVVNFKNKFWNNLLSKIKQDHILAYPEIVPLYSKIANFLGVPENKIMITAGSDYAIKIAFELFVNPEDYIIFLDPTFAMVNVYSGLYNAKPIKIRYDSNLNLNTKKLIDAIGEKTSLVIIANPNSPTGTYINNDTLGAILQKAKQFSVPVLIDEAYYGFCPYTSVDLMESFNNLIVTRTFSKTAGLAGLRIGYIIANEEILNLLYKFRPMYEVNSIAILFASELIDNWEIVDKYISNTEKGKKWLIKRLEDMSFKTINTYTNFIHADFDIYREKILSLFEKNDILIRGGLNIIGCENYTRITVGPINKMQKVIDCVKKALQC